MQKNIDAFQTRVNASNRAQGRFHCTTFVGEHYVSTCRIHGETYYETMVFANFLTNGNEQWLECECRRYSGKQMARRGHRLMVKAMRRGDIRPRVTSYFD